MPPSEDLENGGPNHAHGDEEHQPPQHPVEGHTAGAANTAAEQEGAHTGGGSKKKSKKKKKGGAAGVVEAEDEEEAVAAQLGGLRLAGGAAVGEGRLTQDKVHDLVAAHYRRGAVGKTQDDYKFWSTQPVPKLDEKPEEHGPIDAIKAPKDVKQDQYKLPDGFSWCDVDITNAHEAEEVYNLLNKNYVEDDDNMFRFDYSSAFLQWALTPPGCRRDLVVGIRGTKTGKLLGFITGVPVHMRVYDHQMPMVEINFLCVHKKLRSKRLAPVLIKEITRRVNVTNVWQAVYTAGVVLPKPVSRCRYYHRLLNPKKLIEIGFTRLAPRMTMNMTLKLNRLPDAAKTTLRSMSASDVPSALELLNSYLARFSLAPSMTEEEFAHWLLPREHVVNSYVMVDEHNKVTDLCSFYHLPSSVLHNDKHSKLNAVYSFYNVATTVDLKTLMLDCLVLACGLGVDVFNALDVMENKSIFPDLKFGPGDGHLQYYVYNWKCPEMQPDQVGLVLL